MEIIEFNSLPDHLMLPLTSNQEKLKTSNWNSALQSKGKKFIDKKGNTNYTFVLNGFETETNEKSNNYFDNLVIRHSKKEGVSYFIVRYHPEENWLFESKDFEHFNGRLSFYGLKGNPLGATNLENGKPIAKNQYIKDGDGCNLTIYGEEPFCVGTVDGKLACWIYFDYSISCGGGEGVDTYPYGDVEDPTNSDTGDTGGTGSSGGSNSGDQPGGLDEIDGGFVPELPEEEEPVNLFLEKDVWNENDPYDDWNRLTECEKDFFSSKPYHLLSAVTNRHKAEDAAVYRFGECKVPETGHPLRNTIGDAYRHAYFSALNAQSMGYRDAKALGDAHECGTPDEILDEKEMDLNNNSWGYLYGDTMSIIDEAHFHTTFMNAVQDGQIKILQECL